MRDIVIENCFFEIGFCIRNFALYNYAMILVLTL